MKRRYLLWTIGIILVLAAIWGSFRIGFQLGRDFGRSDYHNTYVRQIQMEASELVRETRKDETSQSHFHSLKVQALAGAAGDDEKFSQVLSARDLAEIEDSGVFVATHCFLGLNQILRLVVDVADDGRILVDGVEFSEEQITVLAKEVSLRQKNEKLHIRASATVSVEIIKKVVAAAGKGGMTDVIFGAPESSDAAR
jgi:hypothetical protein